MDWSQASSQESDCHCHWVQSWGLGNGDGVSFLRSSYTADSVLPKRVPPTGSLGVPNHRFTLPCSVGLGLCPSAALVGGRSSHRICRLWLSLVYPKLRRDLRTSQPLNTVPHRVGLAFTFIFMTAPPQHAVCLPPPAPACGQPLRPCVGPLDAHPSGGCFCSSHGDAWGCRGWQVWLCLFIYSTIVLGGTRRTAGCKAVLVPAESRTLPWNHQYEK